jgi:L-cysteine:1D-myo-inositol 2-amino-2-deoxy-alpha-D-glucopyranoside ligase
MCCQYLGAQLTIHGGGVDLVFPHHESEIAQSEKATRKRPFARFWTHVAMVRMDGEKMSKSLGNMVFLKDLLRTYSADALRLYLLGHHYRQVWEWAPAELEVAAGIAQRLAHAAREPDLAGERSSEREAFAAALQDDLNTPRAIVILQTLRGETLRQLGGVLGLTFESFP